jgi:hypothetical protein
MAVFLCYNIKAVKGYNGRHDWIEPGKSIRGKLINWSFEVEAPLGADQSLKKITLKPNIKCRVAPLISEVCQ